MDPFVPPPSTSVAVMLLFGLVCLLPGVPILAYTLLAKRNRFRTYEQLTKSIRAVGETDTRIPVRYASGEHFAKWLKFSPPWELCGILCIGKDGATFYTRFSSWSDLSLAFDPSTSQVSWLGRPFWRSGFLSWVVIAKAGNKHYFSSETGTMVFGSKRNTTEIYEKLNQCLGEGIS